MRTVIIGGGVAGCAMAAALRGTSLVEGSVLLERRPADAPAGMGFILLRNGLDALAAVAPEFDWAAAGKQITRVSMRSRSGRIFAEYPLEDAVCVSRGTFLRMLRTAADQTQLLEGWGVRNLDRDGAGTTNAVVLDDGGRIEGDLFLACDGAQSRTRRLAMPHAELSDAAVLEIVSVAESPALAARLGNTFRKYHDEEGGLAVGLLAENDRQVVWFIQIDAERWPVERASPEALQRFALERVSGWAPEILEALDATDFTRSHLWPTRDLPPLDRLHVGNLAFLGDAAHACLPFTSQGANGALVDAALLGSLLAQAGSRVDVAAALERYSRLRVPHHRRMFIEGRRLRAEFLSPVPVSGPRIPMVA
ncbi:MAG: FAD-dependent oxidoreductase [Planctomycetota bacterium]